MFPKSEQSNGLAHLECRRSVAETMTRLELLLKEHSLRVFARIDHSAAAAEAGLKMRPTQVLVFGNPVGGTPLMIAAPTLAIDLPFKALVWEDDAGKVWLTYNTPEYLINRHGVPESQARNLSKLVNLLNTAAKQAQRGRRP